MKRRLITREGYGDYFTTRFSHGIGYIKYEQPEIKATSLHRLEKGMAFIIEPGIYGVKSGMRIKIS